MPVFKAPVDDVLFLLNDVFNISQYSHLPRFSEASPDLVEAILLEGAKLCENVVQPLNLSGDHEGCTRHADGSVTTPKGFKEAYKTYCEGGWLGLSAEAMYGGQEMPHLLTSAFSEFLNAANISFAMYPGLTQGAMAAISVHGSDAQKQKFLPKMATGEWTGTMNLTEPHCGTDLGLLRTKAVPAGDGSYKISGQKIFISAGDHDLSDNIIHLVLARIEGAPAGTKGISLFIVPKIMINEDGSLGAKNTLSCGKLEEKMGIHANATAVMNYDAATGYLIGTENKGLAAMFVMMNEARLGVGVQGMAIGEVAYQNAVAYAKERLQGRSLSGPKFPEKPADPIIVHPDVRRNLMTMRALNEAGRALYMASALNADLSHVSTDAAQKQKAEDMLGLLTPIVKGILTDNGFQNAVRAQQMFGGHGFIEEWGMSQFVRDARITMIYEGANGVQALDLVGRKLGANGGRGMMTYMNDVATFCATHKDHETLKPFVASLQKGLDDLQKATMWLMQNAMAKPDNAGAASYDYMQLFGLVAMGNMWGQMVLAASEKLKAGADDRMSQKIAVAKFFFEQLMPETSVHLTRISAGADSLMALPIEAF